MSWRKTGPNPLVSIRSRLGVCPVWTWDEKAGSYGALLLFSLGYIRANVNQLNYLDTSLVLTWLNYLKQACLDIQWEGVKTHCADESDSWGQHIENVAVLANPEAL